MSRLSDALGADQFVITSEIGPPKGVNIEHCLKEAEIIKDRVTAINVTDIQSAVMRFGSMAVCRLLVEKGMEPTDINGVAVNSQGSQRSSYRTSVG